MLLPNMYTHLLATRPEAQVASDWMLVLGARNVQWRFEVLRASFLTCKQNVLLGEDLTTNLEELTSAAKSLSIETTKLYKKSEWDEFAERFKNLSEHSILSKVFANDEDSPFAKSGWRPLKLVCAYLWIHK